MAIEVIFSADTEQKFCEGCANDQTHARGMYRLKVKQPFTHRFNVYAVQADHVDHEKGTNSCSCLITRVEAVSSTYVT